MNTPITFGFKMPVQATPVIQKREHPIDRPKTSLYFSGDDIEDIKIKGDDLKKPLKDHPDLPQNDEKIEWLAQQLAEEAKNQELKRQAACAVGGTFSSAMAGPGALLLFSSVPAILTLSAVFDRLNNKKVLEFRESLKKKLD